MQSKFLDEKLQMLQEDFKDDILKAKMIHALASKIKNFGFQAKKNSLSMSLTSLQEDPQIYSSRNYSFSPALLKTIKQKKICNKLFRF